MSSKTMPFSPWSWFDSGRPVTTGIGVSKSGPCSIVTWPVKSDGPVKAPPPFWKCSPCAMYSLIDAGSWGS